jgi:hypothetical protein
MPDDDERETVASTAASTASGWPLDPERRRPSLPAFDRTDQRFALGAELGRGGMGRVVAATDIALDRPVAIKQATSATPEDLLRFEREVRITARLEHPSIPPVHEAGRDAEGRPFYVMRRVEGDRLADRIRATSSPRTRLALVPNVLAAVDAAAFAHARGVIHRDIKPANILVGAYGETLLIDWGLARRLDETDTSGPRPMPQLPADEPLTRAGSVYGTPGYMAPEQERGEAVDARVDVFALGTTLLHVLVGRHDGTVSIAELDPAVPAELVAIIGKAMAERPEDRYADGGALANDLRAFLAGQLVAAHTYTARERLARFVRKHRVAVLVSAAALVAAIVIGVIAIVGLSSARDRAESARVTAETERALAADRAEVMLLDRASTLAPHDPTRAVALLRQLPTASPHLRRARDIAAAAASYGITRAASTAAGGHLGSIHHLALSPDNHWVATASADGVVRVHRLENGETREVARLAKGVGGVVWTDRGTALCVVTKTGLWRIALDTGRATLLDADARSHDLWLGPGEDRVRFVDDTRGMIERTTREHDPPRILARDVTMAEGRGDVTLIASPARIAVLVGDREILLATAPTLFSPHGLAIAPDGRKVAAGIGNEIVEWAIDGRVLQRYPSTRLAALQYGPRALYAATETELVSLANGVNTRLRENSQVIVWSGLTSMGPAFVGIDGAVIVIDDIGVQVIPGEATTARGIAASPRSSFLASGSLDGRVRWWDLAQRSARVYPGAEGEPCGIDATRFYTYTPGAHLKVIDRASGKIQVIENDLLVQPFFCAAVLARHIALAMPPMPQPGRAVVVDLDTFAMEAIDGIKMIRGDRAVNKLVYARGSKLVERSGAKGTEVVRWTAPEPIENFITNGRWLAAEAGAHLVRIDRATGTELALWLTDGRLAGMTADGRMWWLQGKTLWAWDGITQREIYRFNAEPHSTTSFDDQLGLWLEDGSLWLANRHGVYSRAPAGQRSVRFGHGTAVHADAGATLVMRYLETGEQIVRRARLTSVIHVADDGTLVVGGGTHAIVYESPVPIALDQLSGWLDRATNAQLDPKTGELTWR